MIKGRGMELGKRTSRQRKELNYVHAGEGANLSRIMKAWKTAISETQCGSPFSGATGTTSLSRTTEMQRSGTVEGGQDSVYKTSNESPASERNPDFLLTAVSGRLLVRRIRSTGIHYSTSVCSSEFCNLL